MSLRSRPTLAALLQGAIRTAGKSVSAVAREAGVPQPVLCRFLHGQRGITLETADRLCAYFGLTFGPDRLRPSSAPPDDEPVLMCAQ